MREEIKLKGVVLAQSNLGDSDKILTIFTDKLGVIKAVAGGVRKYKKKNLAGLEIFYFSDFVVWKGKDLYTIKSCNLIESFYGLRMDIKKLSLASYISELTIYVMTYGEANERALSLLLNMFYIISLGKREPDMVKSVYELKLMCMLGYEPCVDSCHICGGKDVCQFDLQGGFVCEEHAGAPFMHDITPGVGKTIRYIIESPDNKCVDFLPSKSVIYDLGVIMEEFLNFHLQKKFKSLDFYKNL